MSCKRSVQSRSGQQFQSAVFLPSDTIPLLGSKVSSIGLRYGSTPTRAYMNIIKISCCVNIAHAEFCILNPKFNH